DHHHISSAEIIANCIRCNASQDSHSARRNQLSCFRFNFWPILPIAQKQQNCITTQLQKLSKCRKHKLPPLHPGQLTADYDNKCVLRKVSPLADLQLISRKENLVIEAGEQWANATLWDCSATA